MGWLICWGRCAARGRVLLWRQRTPSGNQRTTDQQALVSSSHHSPQLPSNSAAAHGSATADTGCQAMRGTSPPSRRLPLSLARPLVHCSLALAGLLAPLGLLDLLAGRSAVRGEMLSWLHRTPAHAVYPTDQHLLPRQAQGGVLPWRHCTPGTATATNRLPGLAAAPSAQCCHPPDNSRNSLTHSRPQSQTSTHTALACSAVH
jgi:hypothetical protein